MKIFYKKDYQRAMVELEKMKNRVRELEKEYKKQEINFNITKKDFELMQKENESLNSSLENLEIKLKSVCSAKGGLTKQVNSLTKENQDLKQKLKEAMSDKYLKKTIPAGRTPHIQKTKVTKTPSLKVSNFLKKEKQ